MSGPRITRKVTVEVGKKVTESVVPSSVVQPSSSSSSSSVNPRRSVFERLGPGAVDRPKTRESYTPDKCRNWLRDGRCPYGNNCKFLHGPYTDPKPRTKSVRSIVHGGSKDRYDDPDEKQQYHSRSFDSVDFDDDDIIEAPKVKRRHKSEEGISDSPVKKTSKSKKKHKEELEEDDDEAKLKRKRKTHRKRDVSPKPKAHSPDEDEEDYERPSKPVGDWEDASDLDFERQLELERRRQDLQRQLALIDQEDAAASAEEPEWKGKEKEDDRKVPIVHSKLHPDPSPSTTGGETPTQTVKKKKKKKTDSEGKKTKVKKEGASPRKKEESNKRKVSLTGDEEDISRKEESIKMKAKKTVTKLLGSSEEDDLPEHQPMERDTRKVSRHSADVKTIEHHESPTRERSGGRKRADSDQIKHKRDESKEGKDRRKVELSSGVSRHVDDSHPRRLRNTSQEYYPSADEQDDENRRVRSRVKGPNEPKRADEGITEDRGRHRGVEERMSSRGPRTPSPPSHVKDEQYYYDEQQEKRPPRGPPPRTPPREPTRDDTMYGKDARGGVAYRKEARGRPEDSRGPRTPSDDEARFSPAPGQGETKGTRYSERDRAPPRREQRERGPVVEQGDKRYTERSGRVAIDTDYDRRKPRDEDPKTRRPPDYPRTKDDEYMKHRGRDENYARDEEFIRPREREDIKSDYQKSKYRDERVDNVPGRPRGREDGEFLRGRERDERDDDSRGPPQRDVHGRVHDDHEGNERDQRDDRGRPRSDYPDSRRDGRYVSTPDTDQYRRPSPSQPPPPRGRSPHRFDDRRRPDDGYRPGPGPRDGPGRGRAMGRGRAYTSLYDNRGKPMDTRRRSPPPPGPRGSFQDRGRGVPRGRDGPRDGPMGWGRGYVDKSRPPNDRYRDPNVPWDRRGDREYPPRDPGVRDRRGRESPPPPQGYRDERVWEERERRGSSPRPGSMPSQDRRGPYEHEQEGKVRVGIRERHSLERGPPEWEYENDPNKPLRKRTRPISGRLESPFDSKKPRVQSPISPDEGPVTEDLPMEGAEPERPKKAALVTKDGKKIKKKKKDGKVSKAASVTGGESMTEVSADEGKIKGEKKFKKEKKLKEKGLKKKKKSSIPGLEGGQADDVDIVPARLTEQAIDAEAPGAPKVGKKRRQAVSSEGDKDSEKPKKKKKKKHQPEVLVQPWNDLEGEEEDDETLKAEEKLTDEGHSSKTQDNMFSDWSDDDSPVGEESWPDESENSQKSTTEAHKEDKLTEAKDLSTEDKGPSFDDVYDPISDDEFDAMYTQSDEEEIKKEEGTSKPLGVEEVDWSSLGIAQDINKDKEPLSHLDKFTPSYVFSRIGISPTLAGQRITQLALEACTKSKEVKGIELFIPEEGPKCTGAFVAVAAAKKRDREAVLGNLGPCRRALCARRDLAMRKHLGRTTKVGKMSLFAASPSTPVDNELFQMSVALYKKDTSINDNSVRLIPSKVGSILLSQG